MDLKAIRDDVNNHPGGVSIRMIDGTVYRAPHRDYIWLGPPPEERGMRGPHSTSFIVHTEGNEMRLINALLVAEITKLKRNGNGHGGTGKKRKPKRG